MPELRTHLRERRLRAGWTQQVLAERAGVTRQTVAGIEAGRYGPGVAVGLRLAHALGCRVEDLFTLAAPPVETVTDSGPRPQRIALGRIAGRSVARPLSGLGALRWAAVAAHGLALGPEGTSVHTFAGAPPAVFLGGCDPALGLLGAHAARAPGRPEVLWWHAGNGEALAQLRDGRLHGAAVHGTADAPAPATGLSGWRLGRWRLGLLVHPDNPLGIQAIGDLARPGLRLAGREPGSGARALLDRLLAAAGTEVAAIAGYDHPLDGHAAVADAVAAGLADAGVAAEIAAWERGLRFIPLAEEVCDLWVPDGLGGDPGVAALLQALTSGAFRADLAAFGPYDTTETGKALA